MNAQEIIERIRTAEKKTPVRVFLKAREPVEFPHATVFPCGETTLVFGDWKDIGPVLEGCRVGKGAVVAAGAVVVSDVAPNTVVAGVPARVLKDKDGKTAEKTALIDALRAL